MSNDAQSGFFSLKDDDAAAALTDGASVEQSAAVSTVSTVSTAVGSILDGRVVKIKPFGAIVLLPDETQGLVHISQVSDSFVQDINDILAVDDIVRVKVLSKDEANGKITLSMKAAADGSKRVKPFQSAGRGRGFERGDNLSDIDPAKKNAEMSFDDKLKDWIRQSNERQAGINKRNNRR